MAFLDVLAEVELHSLMVLRHGKVIAEGWWGPYRPDEIQLGYSLSKSVTSIALGYALDEGLFGLDDIVTDLFGAGASGLDPRYGRLRVRDLAQMTTGHHTDPLEDVAEWPPLDAEPGGVWIYNNWATWKLGELIQQRAGKSLSSYLEPRLFEPLDIEDWAWLRLGEHEQGFSGLHLATESWAKIGHLLLRGGELWDRQVIPAAYLEEATSVLVGTATEPDGRLREVGADNRRGYGYQFWASRHGYRAEGALGQFLCVLPEADAVLVLTAATGDGQAILDAVWTHLLPAFGEDARGSGAPEVPSADDEALAERLGALTLPPLSSRAPDQGASFQSGPDNRVFTALQQLAASDDDRHWDLTLWLPWGTSTLRAGDGFWITGEMPAGARDTLPVGASAGWSTEDTFEIEMRSLTTPHGIRIVCDSTTGHFSTHWLAEPLRSPKFTDLAFATGLRHRG